jgi:hypothetical protein
MNYIFYYYTQKERNAKTHKICKIAIKTRPLYLAIKRQMIDIFADQKFR